MLRRINYVRKYAFLYIFVFLWIINGEASSFPSLVKVPGVSIIGCCFYAQYGIETFKRGDKIVRREVRIVTKSCWNTEKGKDLSDDFLIQAFKDILPKEPSDNIEFKTGDIKEEDLIYKAFKGNQSIAKSLNNFIRNLFIMNVYQVDPKFFITNTQEVSSEVKDKIIKNIQTDGSFTEWSEKKRKKIEKNIIDNIYCQDTFNAPYVIVGDHTLAFGYYYGDPKSKDKNFKSKAGSQKDVYWFIFRLEPVEYLFNNRQKKGKKIVIDYIIDNKTPRH